MSAHWGPSCQLILMSFVEQLHEELGCWCCVRGLCSCPHASGPNRPHGSTRLDIVEPQHYGAGLEAAIVDANDLGRVDILGASSGVQAAQVEQMLASNPAGNSDQRTPLVLVHATS